jgi:hypothetical protein
MTKQDKLKKLIKNEVFIAIQRAFPSCIDEECVKPGIADKHDAATEATDSILSLLAPELEKARKYDEAYAERPWVIDHDRWWKEMKMILDRAEEKSDA